MRNSKVKGFTLIELIVVIAIIGVLAAILVPSMLGYVRNARISSANANAKQIHTAVSSALTQLGISNYFSSTVTDGKIEISPAEGTGDAAKIPAEVSGLTGASQSKNGDMTAQMDLVSYLGESFKGNAVAYFSPSTYSCYCAAWASNATVLGTAGADKAAILAKTEQTQKADAKAGNIYGIFPAPTLS